LRFFHAVEKLCDAGDAKTIENLEALFSVGDHACGFENGQVFGNGGNVRAHQSLEFADTTFTLG
jgi:hypothetical protein